MTCFDEFAGRWNFGVKNLKKINRIMEKHACLYDISTKAFSDRDLLRADWLYAVQLGQLHCRSSATVELRR